MNRQEEVREKEARLRSLLDATGLDGVVLKKQANFSWLTGGGCNRVGLATETGATSLLITRSARYVIASRIEMQRMLTEESLAELGFEPLEYEWYEAGELAAVKKIVPDLVRLGTDVELPGVRLLDGAVGKLRCRLTPPEIERFKFLGEKASRAVEKVMLGVKPGDSELEIAGRIGPELWPCGIDPSMILVAADERIFAYRHPVPTEKMLRRQLMLALNVRYKGLVLSLTRMLIFGRPSAALARQYRNNLIIECRMIAATQPGCEFKDIFAVAVAAYEEFGAAGEWRLHHQGGGIGYAGREFKVTPAMTGVVEENQGFCWNPSITGTKTEDSFIATATGPILLSHPVAFPREKIKVGEFDFVRPGLLVCD